MLEPIQRFINALRTAGLRIASSEAIDAARAVQELGIDRREPFRAALRSTLVKRQRDLAVFERTFASFFRVPTPSHRRPGARREKGPGAGTGRRRPAASIDPLAQRRSQQAARIARREELAQRDRSRPNPLEIRLSKRLDPPGGSCHRVARGARSPGRSVPPGSRRRARAADHRRLDLAARLAPEEWEALAEEIPRLIRRIRLLAGRRQRAAARGDPWPAKLARSSAGTGGIPFVIPTRRKRPRRPRVVLLADVSWSVSRVTGLFLMLASSFLKRARRSTIHLFVDRCLDATRSLASWDHDGPVSFGRFVDSLTELDPLAPSDYGRAFYQAATSRRGLLGDCRRDTLLVVLGDARTNGRDPQAWAFERIASRCRRVIWLDPEPEALWDTGDSVLSEYLPYCDLVCETRDLEGLADGVAAILRDL